MPDNNLPNIELTRSQEIVLKQLTDFVFNSSDRVFILKGYAGTGKTTLMRFLIKELKKKNQMYKLLSTTGRAAKILANHTGCDAKTIHGTIYKYKDFNKDVSDYDPKNTTPDQTGQLYLVFESVCLDDAERKSCVYIIDESSMISDTATADVTQALFGNGRLLKELLDYDTLPESKYIFVGDPCQLPPIEGNYSPALIPGYFQQTFGLKAQQAELTQIMRQDNSIVKAGEYLRKLWNNAPESSSVYSKKVWGAPLQLSGYGDFKIHSDYTELEELYYENITKNGYTDSTFICSSNKKSRDLSLTIRQRLGICGLVSAGDLIMVTQNQLTTGLMNGDMVEVITAKNDTERIVHNVASPDGYKTELLFREVAVKELFTGRKVTTLMLDNTLQTNLNKLDSRQQTGLFLDFILRMKRRGIDAKKNPEQFQDAMYKDPYLNALRCCYGYAITCHKAQGGEWKTVFIQTPRDITLNPVKSKYQWFYTAITRAKETVHLVKDFYFK